VSKIVAMIPARMGSKRVKKKNIRLLNGKPMVQYVIDAAKESGCFDEIWVNSESEVLEKISVQSGVNFYKRPHELCTDNVGSDLFVYDFIKLDKVFLKYEIQQTISSPLVQIIKQSFPDSLIIFEGVETESDLGFVHSLGVDGIQGFYLSKPVYFTDKRVA